MAKRRERPGDSPDLLFYPAGSPKSEKRTFQLPLLSIIDHHHFSYFNPQLLGHYQNFGKWLTIAGIGLTALGLVVILGGRLGLFRLPGDLRFASKTWRIYIPITTCILIYIILILILWLIRHLRQ